MTIKTTKWFGFVGTVLSVTSCGFKPEVPTNTSPDGSGEASSEFKKSNELNQLNASVKEGSEPQNYEVMIPVSGREGTLVRHIGDESTVLFQQSLGGLQAAKAINEFRDFGRFGGQAVTYQWISASGESELSRFEFPEDLVISEDFLSNPQNVKLISQKNWNRIFWDHDVSLRTQGDTVVLRGRSLIVKGSGRIETFQNVDSALEGQHGKSAGLVSIQIEGQASGHLEVVMRGQRGGPGLPGLAGANGVDGRDGTDAKYSWSAVAGQGLVCTRGPTRGGNGAAGFPGKTGGAGFSGGDAGRLEIKIGLRENFTLRTSFLPGLGGLGGVGGPGGLGGLGKEGGRWFFEGEARVGVPCPGEGDHYEIMRMGRAESGAPGPRGTTGLGGKVGLAGGAGIFCEQDLCQVASQR